MKTVRAVLPSVAALLREQLDAVSSLRVGKLRKTDADLLSEYLFGDEELSDPDKARAERIGASLLLLLVIGESKGLIVTDGAFTRILKEFERRIRLSNRQYEEFLAYEFIAKLADMGRRARMVHWFWVKTPPSRTVAALCREAYRTYIYGCHSASVALIRSVVEARLKEALGKDILSLEHDPGFRELEKEARSKGLYNAQVWARIKDIRQCAGRALHRGRAPTEQQNLSMIKHAQVVLEFLHRDHR